MYDIYKLFACGTDIVINWYASFGGGKFLTNFSQFNFQCLYHIFSGGNIDVFLSKN